MTEILLGNRHHRIGSAIPCLAADDFGGANGGDNVGVVVSPLSRQEETSEMAVLVRNWSSGSSPT